MNSCENNQQNVNVKCKYHKQHNQTVLRDSILRLYFVDYFLKYHVKFKNYSFRSAEIVVQIFVPNLYVL